MSRGKVIVDHGTWLGAAGDGRFVQRARSAYLDTGRPVEAVAPAKEPALV
jgi:hypothetical protein